MTGNGVFALTAVSAVTLLAATTDLWKFKVYNALTFPAILIGVVASGLLGGFPGLGASLLGAGVGFGAMVIFFALGGVGAGDVKLFTALGAWLGPMVTLQVFAASAVAAGLYALGLIAIRGGLTVAMTDLVLLGYRMVTPSRWSRPNARIDVEVDRADRRSRLVPFAAMTCLGFFYVWVESQGDLRQAVPSSGSAATVMLDRPGGGR